MVNPSTPLDKRDIEYDPLTGSYVVQYDPDQISRLTTFIVKFIATISEESVSELPQISRYIPPDDLNEFLITERAQIADVEMKFTYAGYRITIITSGEIQAQSVTEESGCL